MENPEMSGNLTAVGEMSDFTECRGSVAEKNLVRESGLKLFIVSCIDHNTSVMRVTLNMGRNAANHQGISHCMESGYRDFYFLSASLYFCKRGAY